MKLTGWFFMLSAWTIVTVLMVYCVVVLFNSGNRMNDQTREIDSNGEA